MDQSDENFAKLIIEIVPKTMGFIRAQMRAVAGSEFTVPQYRLLSHIVRNEHSTNGDLAQWMGVSAPTMSKMVDSLVNRGLVNRKTRSGDARQTFISATAKGTQKAKSIQSAVITALALKLSPMTQNKKEALAQGLEFLREIIF